MPYLMHFNPNHDRLGRFTFSRNVTKYTKTNKVDSWGTSEDNNILYVTGVSGSGKSTLALSMANNKTDTVHLDVYLEMPNQKQFRNKALDQYLKRKNFDVSKLSNHSIDKKERFKYIDEFAEKHLQNFAKEQFKKGRKVIVEGVQLADDTMYPDKSFFKDKAVMVINTPALLSAIRSSIRDNKKMTLTDIKERIDWDKYLNKNFNEIVSNNNVEKGKAFVNQHLGINIY